MADDPALAWYRSHVVALTDRLPEEDADRFRDQARPYMRAYVNDGRIVQGLIDLVSRWEKAHPMG